VQDFETSRYLDSTYPKAQRISSMRSAQIISSSIYILFISLSTILFKNDYGADITAIIKMITPVALILPILISITAIFSQFSAAVADTERSNGPIRELSKDKISTKVGYVIILTIAIFLTWATNVNEIISYASRAFALYYAIQCAVAICIVQEEKVSISKITMLKFSVALVLSTLVFILGLPAE